MHICLTDDKSGLILTIEAGLVMSTQRDPQTKLVTMVLTGVQGPQGLKMIAVRETPMEIARRVNAALVCQFSAGEIKASEEMLGFQNN